MVFIDCSVECKVSLFEFLKEKVDAFLTIILRLETQFVIAGKTQRINEENFLVMSELLDHEKRMIRNLIKKLKMR